MAKRRPCVVVDIREAKKQREVEALRREWDASQAEVKAAMRRNYSLYRELCSMGVQVA